MNVLKKAVEIADIILNTYQSITEYCEKVTDEILL